MRIAKSDTIGGLPAPLARSLVRKFRGGPTVQDAAQQLLKENGFESADTVFAGLEAGGYLEKFDTDSDGDVWWEATILGNALAMAGFGKPISRKTADRLVAGLLERAHEYNADGCKPLFVERLRIFGSYLRPDVDPLGDVDVELIFGRRITDPKAIHDYTKASGRMFGSYIDQLMWPQTELVQHLRNRSAALNITLEDVDRFTDKSEVVYTVDGDPGAAPPPADRSLVGRF
jgi:predicted nucleotidyltransferase